MLIFKCKLEVDKKQDEVIVEKIKMKNHRHYGSFFRFDRKRK